MPKSLKNSFLRKALSLIPVAKHPINSQKRILVVTTTALGDTLWATPSLQSLRDSFPDAYIAVLTSAIGSQVLKNNPSLNKLYSFEEPLSLRFLSLWKTLYREKFDTVLIFHASQRLIFPLCSLLGARQIIGTAGLNKGLDSLFTRTLPNEHQHEIIRRMKIIESIGAAAASETLLFVPECHLSLLPPGKKWIALHPGSKDSFKRWPTQNFAEVGHRLKEQLGYEILITGTRSEKALMEETAAKIPGAHLADPDLPLHTFASLLQEIDLLISNDTGPVHLACALDLPVVAIYSATDPSLCGPYRAKKAAIIYKPRTCEPCLKRRCRRPFCLLQVRPEEVFQAAVKLLSLHKMKPG